MRANWWMRSCDWVIEILLYQPTELDSQLKQYDSLYSQGSSIKGGSIENGAQTPRTRCPLFKRTLNIRAPRPH